MKALYVRIYLTVVLVLAAFAFASAWLFQHQIEQERGSADAAASERLTAIALLVHRALPPASAPREDQAASLREWGQRLRMAIALEDVQGKRIAASDAFLRREDEPGARRLAVDLEDGRSLVIMRQFRPQGAAVGGPAGAQGQRPPPRREDTFNLGMLNHRLGGEALALLLVLLFFAVAAGAYPVVRRLTRRLEGLQRGVERFGEGNLSHRVDDEGKDEVARLAASFNRAAGQIETLLRSHQSLLANASHELRSPLARLKMAFSMFEEASPAQRERLRREIETNIGELDALVEEVLLASRLESGSGEPHRDPVDLLGVAAEEAAKSGAELDVGNGMSDLRVLGEERLLRRALRNLLENARRYGGGEVKLQMQRDLREAQLRVCDRGPGVPPEMRERIFEPFFRLPGHAEQAGGVGLGLSLVKQIAQRHQGSVRCEARDGGGSCFVLTLPLG
ncbi:HAMP domain-containing protein [Pelomonas sp. V22]|uniref:ATP-binding protein n=1 Tax=Pelomonas sp. V22 TaxID=2822139 RepID=UPI0024A982CF|nr:ATP-binding protein [Pelomonas sp. V22]MDI4631777.1 HAMP domain-containing protein [Pelomonas sp. V22]